MAESPPSDPPASAGQDFGFDVRIAWRRDDPRIEADAIDFWRRNALLPDDVDPAARAKELTGVAYKNGRIVAVATATLAEIEALRARFAILRAATDADFRRSHAQRAMAVPIREAVRTWALANPEERVAGRIAFLDQGEWGDLVRQPVWPTSRLMLAGYDERGRQVRVDWFDHYRYEGGSDTKPVQAPSIAPELVRDVELRLAWRLNDARIEADAISFWARLGILAADADPGERAREVVAAVYKGDWIVALCTAQLAVLPQIRARLAMVRGAVDPEFRRSQIGRVMLFRGRQLLESWSAENPHERVAGLGAILESQQLVEAQRQPYADLSKMGVIGFTPDGRQIRVSWFEDFRLD
jgi:hypothetical protein